MENSSKKIKALNKDALSAVASRAANGRLSSTRLPSAQSSIAALFTINKQFNRTITNQLGSCNYVHLWSTYCKLSTPDGTEYRLEPKIFAAFNELGLLNVTRLLLQSDFSEVGSIKFTGLRHLELRSSGSYRSALEHVVRIISDNRSSLKELLGVHESLFSRLPSGMDLDVFSTSDVKPSDVKIPALNTKLFKYDTAPNNTFIPLSFMRTVNADEMELKIFRILPASPKNRFAPTPVNCRTKKLSFDFIDERVDRLDFGHIFRDVAICCPKLEFFEIRHEKHFNARKYSYAEFVAAVNSLVTCFERALQVSSSVSYKVDLKTHVWYNHYDSKLARNPSSADFPGSALRADLPPTEEVDSDSEHFYFTKEVLSGSNTMKMDCEVVQVDQSSDDYDSYDSDEAHIISD